MIPAPIFTFSQIHELIKEHLESNYNFDPRKVTKDYDLGPYFMNPGFEQVFLDDLIERTGINIAGMLDYDHLTVEDIVETFLAQSTGEQTSDGTFSTTTGLGARL